MINLFIVSRYLFAVTIAVFGIQHFMYAGFVATLVPGWIPLPLFWAYLVGAAMILAAVSIVINKRARLACLLLGGMIFLFVALIHAPLLIKNIHDGSRITDAFKDAGLGCCAFILGNTFSEKG